jgi:hypothetical protein
MYIEVSNDRQQYFSYIMATSFSGGGSQSTRREPKTMGKQLVNFITWGCESSPPFFVTYKEKHLILLYILDMGSEKKKKKKKKKIKEELESD